MTIDQKLHQAWQRERSFAHTRGAATFLSWLAVLAVGDFLIDWLFLLPGYARFMLLISNVVFLSWLVHRRWRCALRRYSPTRLALQVEGIHPGLHSLLVSYVQLADASGENSPVLIRAMRRQADQHASPLHFSDIVDFNDLKRLVSISVLLLIALAGSIIRWPDHFRILAIRMINPVTAATYPTQTQVETLTGDQTIRRGDEQQIGFRAHGVMPKRGTLLVRTKGRSSWEAFYLGREEDGTFAHTFPEVLRSFDYRARIGDGRTTTYRIEVIPPPRTVEPRLSVELPTYMNLPAQTLDNLNADIYEGSRIEWQLRFNQPLKSASILIEGSDPLPVSLSSDGSSGTAQLKPEDSFGYQIEMTLKEHPFTFQEGVHYAITLLPDEPPRVSIITPKNEKEIATRKRQLSVKFRAEDQHQVAAAWFVYSINAGEETHRPIGKYTDRLVTANVALNLPGLVPYIKEGDIFQYAIEVADNRQSATGPNLARSQKRKIEIVSVETFLLKLATQRKKLGTAIEAVHREEKEGREKVKSMAGELE
jgi:hypothetical protein